MYLVVRGGSMFDAHNAFREKHLQIYIFINNKLHLKQASNKMTANLQ